MDKNAMSVLEHLPITTDAVNRHKAASILGVSVRTLQRWHVKGYGPPRKASRGKGFPSAPRSKTGLVPLTANKRTSVASEDDQQPKLDRQRLRQMKRFVAENQRAHSAKLMSKIADAHEAGKEKRLAWHVRKCLQSFDARAAATDAAYKALSPNKRPNHSTLRAVAESLDPWKGTGEPVQVFLRPKTSDPDDYRIVMEFGLENRALQYLILPVLERLCRLHPCQYGCVRGNQAAVAQAAKWLEHDPLWAAEIDVTDCYQSFDEEKLVALLPLPKEVSEAVLVSRNLNLISGNISQLIGSADSDGLDNTMADEVMLNARRGIPQGSATSPLLAEAALSYSLAEVPPMGHMVGYQDNTLLLAQKQDDVERMTKALWSALEASPVGRLKPKVKRYSPGEPIIFLGHRLTVDNGDVLIEPSERNLIKFQNNVARFSKKLRGFKKTDHRRKRGEKRLKRYVQSWVSAFSLCQNIEGVVSKITH